MKTYFLLFILMIQYIFCDNLLSKFHQSDYKMKDLRIQMMYFDKNYYNFYQITAFKFNRSTTAHNLTWSFKVDVKDKIEIVVQVYKFLSNEYRDFPIRFQVNFQKSFEANIIGIQEAVKCGNMTNCIFYKDITYHVCNFVINETRFPPLIPTGKYKVEVLGLYLNVEISNINIFGEIYRPMPYPKKRKSKNFRKTDSIF